MKRRTNGQKPGAVLSTVPGPRPLLVDGKDLHMTMEELQQLIEDQTQQLADLEAERDSLRAENEELRKRDSERETELKETKKMNFTLSRQLDRQPSKSIEEMLNEFF